MYFSTYGPCMYLFPIWPMYVFIPLMAHVCIHLPYGHLHCTYICIPPMSINILFKLWPMYNISISPMAHVCIYFTYGPCMYLSNLWLMYLSIYPMVMYNVHTLYIFFFSHCPLMSFSTYGPCMYICIYFPYGPCMYLFLF